MYYPQASRAQACKMTPKVGVAHKISRSEGYSSRSVCLSVCLSVCVSTTILALQATRRLMSDTNSFSATRARK